MSGPEKLIKTLHKRKVAPQNQYYRVHYHHRHRHHRRQPHHHKATLHKRGWGRMAELGETYYEHLVADDNVGSAPTLFSNRYGATISPGFDQIAETRQTFLGALHK